MRRPQKEPDTFDFAFSGADVESSDGFSTRFYEFTVEREAQQLGWLEALPAPREFTVKGYLHKKRFGAMKLGGDGFDARYAVRILPVICLLPCSYTPPTHTANTTQPTTTLPPSAPPLPRVLPLLFVMPLLRVTPAPPCAPPSKQP